MNLTIKIGGEVVDVTSELVCNLKKQSPMFLRDEVMGDYAEEIILPFTVRNDRILGYYRHPQVLASPTKMYCEQYVNSNRLARGYVLPLEAISDYKLGYTSNLEAVFGNLRTKSLREIDFGTLPIPSDFDVTLSNTYATGGYVFPSIKNPDFYQNMPAGFSGIINECTAGHYTSSTKVPMFFLRYILDQIATKVDYEFSFDTPEINRFLIYNTLSLDELNTIYPQNHLPDLPLGVFLLEVAKLTNSALFFDAPNRKLQFRTRKSVYQADCTLDWSKKAKPILGKIPTNISGLELSFSVDSDDATTKVQHPYFDGYLTAGAEENIFKVQTVWSSLITDGGLPFTLQQGITTGQNDKHFTPRVLLWAGVVDGVPVALPEVSGLGLYWNGANGLYNTYYKEEESFLMNTFRTPPVDLYLTESDLAGWTPDRKIHINGVNYIFEEIVCPLHNLSLGCVGHGYRIN